MLLRVMSGDLAEVLNSVCSRKLLSREEEATLARQVQAGNVAALHELTLANIRLVVSQLKRRFRYLPQTDAINVGWIGLQEAAQRYDPDKGTRFATYAMWWIHNKLRNFDDDYALIRVPSRAKALYGAVERERDDFFKSRGYSPNESVLAERASRGDVTLSEAAVRTLLVKNTNVKFQSLDAIQESNDDVNELFASADTVQQNERMAQIRSAVELLPLRERYVLTLRYLTSPEMSRREVSEHMGISRQRVCQIENAALERMRTPKYAQILRTE
jgi:RNA polymerase sigma factor (sigma-70 family)